MRKVEALPSGRYKVRFRHGLAKDGKSKRQASETFDTKKEAETFATFLDIFDDPQRALDQMFEESQQGAIPRVNELATQHIDSLPNVTDGTRLNYHRLWGRTWGPAFGTLPVTHLTGDDVSKAVRELGKRYSHKSLENQRGLLAAILDRAVKQGHLPENPAKGMALPDGQPSREAEDMRILTPDEFESVEERMHPHYRPLIRFLFGTGCRWGEAVALPSGKLRLPNVSFHQALKWSPDNERVIGPPKTKRSRRTIVVPGDLHDELRELQDGKGAKDFVFTAHRGGMVLHRTFWGRYWLPAVAHLEPRPRIHDLRHSHASWLLGQGVPVHVVSQRLGHRSADVTYQVYTHLLPDAQLVAASAAQLAFNPRAIES